MTLSPAEKFAAVKRKGANPETEKFISRYPFDLDDFQIQGCHALESGHSVLVAAPTGAGKTIVGEFAAHLAMASGKKYFFSFFFTYRIPVCMHKWEAIKTFKTGSNYVVRNLKCNKYCIHCKSI